MVIMLEYLWLLFSYLFASIPNGYLITKWVSGKDIREIDKQKLSGSNIIQNIGILPGALSGGFDLLKGIIAVFGAQMLGLTVIFQVLAGVFALCGQMWPIFFHFWGGRGGSVCIGALLILSFKIAGIGILIWIASKLISKKYGASLGMIFFLFISAILGWRYEMDGVLIFSLVALILVLVQRVLGRPGSLKKIQDKKIILWRLLLDRDSKEK
jgi:glycerol-3-phosphate acyltransferase PlsY